MKSVYMKTELRVYLIIFVMLLLGACSKSSQDKDLTPQPEMAPEVLEAQIDSPAGRQTIYSGESLNFEGSLKGGSPPYSYTWDFASAAQLSTQQDPGQVVFSRPGTYTVVFAVRDNFGEYAEDSVPIEVVADTTPEALIDSPKEDVVISEGEAVTFAASVSKGNPPIRYEWDFSGQAAPSGKEDPGSITFPDTGTYPIRFTVSDRDGDTDSAAVTIEVKQNIPDAVIVSPKENPVIFQGESVLFSGAVHGGNAPLRYAWDFGGGAQNSSQKRPGNVVFASPGVYQVMFTAQDVHKDRDSDERTITVIEDLKPRAYIISPDKDVAILDGCSVNFRSFVQGGNQPLKLDWDFGGAAMNSSTQDPGSIMFSDPGSIMFSDPGTYRITFTVKDANNDTISESRTITVIKDTIPVVSIDSPGDGTVITEKGSLIFHSRVKDGNEPLSYVWDFGGARENIHVKDPGELLLSTIGTFQVRMTVTDADGDTGSDAITLQVARDTHPRARIDSPRRDLRIYEGESVVFAGSVVDGNNPMKFKWDFEGGAKKSRVKDPGEVVFDKAGSYTVSFAVEDNDGDKDSDTVTITVIKSTWSYVAGGWSHSIGLKTDGSLWAWGWNLQGQLGNGLNASCNMPVHVGEERNWKLFASGSAHTLAIRTDGSLWVWGSNTAGQLGIGQRKQTFSPVRVGTDTTWACIAAGSNHSLAVKRDGSLWVWGRNTEGQLGDGSYAYSIIPVMIGSGKDWRMVAAGEAHSMAVKEGGSLWAWGSNELGQLGDGTQVDNPAPKHIAPGTQWTSIAAGKRHSLAVRKDGTLWAWGANLWGQLGDGTKVFKAAPIQIGCDTDWEYVSAGEYHSVALRKDGSIWAWGWNAFGQLGIDSFTDIHTPARIGSDKDWVKITAGLHHTLAVKKNGTLWAWGYNGYGQVGDKTNEDKCGPVLIR